MVRVPWEKLAESPKISESLVTLLMLRLRTSAQAVDGTGGDGGRDLYEYTPANELLLYEAKSFTGRMVSGRRSQVIDSLRSAARHQPDHWDLLVPIDPTPSEQRWFDSLRAEFPFVRSWRGRSWLDMQFAKHPDLVRYALQQTGDYILERIAEARAERDVLLNVPDYLDRVQVLHARAQEISPHYALRAEVDASGNSTVHVTPKGPGGHVPFNFNLTFRNSEVGGAEKRRMEEVMRCGGKVELTSDHLVEASVTGPAELGLGTLSLGGLRITSPREELSPPLSAQLAVRRDSGIPVVSLPLHFTQRDTGVAGSTLHGGDLNNFLGVRLRVDRGTRTCNLTFDVDLSAPSLPQNMLPVLRMIGSARPGRFLALTLAGRNQGRMTAQVTTDMTFGTLSPEEAMWWADAFEDLIRLQNRTGHYFAVPEDFTKRDALDVKEALSLIDGETVTLRAKSLSIEVTTSEALEQLAAGPQFRLEALSESLNFKIGDHEIDLGPGIETCTTDQVLNLKQARRELSRSGQATVHMSVSERFPVTRRLGTSLSSEAS
ncbi:hypothetical protein ACFV2I_38250 [Streptomyces microflavus]|uniref:hypothetical protein n=1 Tax=Streptomyces microflavus TaxID=1919 RepID=UPI00363F65BE